MDATSASARAWTTRFSTLDHPSGDQMDAARNYLTQRFGTVDIGRPNSRPFQATFEAVAWPELSIWEMSGDGLYTERTWKHVSRDEIDCFMVSFIEKGRGVVEQDGRFSRFGPGDVVIGNLRRPFRFGFEEPYRKIAFQCNWNEFAARFPEAGRRTAVRLASSAAVPNIVAGYVGSLIKDPSHLGLLDSLVARHAMDVLSTQLRISLSHDPTMHSALLRIQAYIEQHLANPALAPTQIADHHRVSLRQLYRLFNERGESVANYIRRRRLLRSQAMLANPLYAARSISEIAFAWGFNDATTFGRAFRASFGMTPRRYRQLTLST